MNMDNEDLLMYRGIVHAHYPEHKQRGDGDACMVSRQTLLEHLLLLPVTDLQRVENRFRICALAFDACIFVESGPQKGDISDFKYDVVSMLTAIMKKLRPELAESIFYLLHDLEYEETYHRKPFMTHDETLRELQHYGIENKSEDDFEKRQRVEAQDLGLDNLEDE